MNIGAKPDVVGEIPADVVRILEDRDRVAVPKPVVAVTEIEISNAKEKAAKPETARAASHQSPNVAAAEAAGEVAVLPGMVEVEAGVIAPRVMPDPRSVVVYMWRFGMALVVRARMRFMRRAMIRGRTVTGDESTADSVAASAS